MSLNVTYTGYGTDMSTTIEDLAVWLKDNQVALTDDATIHFREFSFSRDPNSNFTGKCQVIITDGGSHFAFNTEIQWTQIGRPIFFWPVHPEILGLDFSAPLYRMSPFLAEKAQDQLFGLLPIRSCGPKRQIT